MDLHSVDHPAQDAFADAVLASNYFDLDKGDNGRPGIRIGVKVGVKVRVGGRKGVRDWVGVDVGVGVSVMVGEGVSLGIPVKVGSGVPLGVTSVVVTVRVGVDVASFGLGASWTANNPRQ